MNIHILGLPHSITNTNFFSCFYTKGLYNFLLMMDDDSIIDDIYHYGHPASNLPDRIINIPVTDDDVLMHAYGYYSGTEYFPNKFEYTFDDHAYITFNERTIPLIKENIEKDDMVLFSCGYGHELIYNSIRPLQELEEISCIEYMVGYDNTLVDYFRVFLSQSHRMAIDYKDGKINNNDKMKDRVIQWGPNPDDFEFNDEKEDYFMYLGGMQENKGVDLSIQLANTLNLNLKIAGQGLLSDLQYEEDAMGDNIEVLGVIDDDEKKLLLKNAKGLLAPSLCYDFLGNEVIEAMLSGTPVIATDWGGHTEMIINGVNGFLCNTYAEFKTAIENIDKIDKQECFQTAFNKFNYDNIKNQYLNYFDYIFNVLNGSGFYEGL